MGHAAALIGLLALALPAARTAKPLQGTAKPLQGTGPPAQAGTPNSGTLALPAPPARVSVAGMRGFETVSTLVFEADKAHPHTLRATYAFPARARWWLGVGEGATLEREMRYRYGTQSFLVPRGQNASRAAEGAEALEIAAQLELRRALFLWPDGFEWKGTGAERTVSLGETGSLIARLDGPGATKLPLEIEWRNHEGTAVDALKNVRWKAIGGRPWPSALELWHADALVWRESVVSVDGAQRTIEATFVPADRREAYALRGHQVGGVESIDIPRLCSRRIEIAAGTTLEALTQELENRWKDEDAALAPHELSVEKRATVEIGDDLAPRALWLRLEALPRVAPPGYEIRAERPALSLAVPDASEITSTRLSELRRRAPTDARPESPYLRFDPRSKKAGVRLVLPLAPGT